MHERSDNSGPSPNFFLQKENPPRIRFDLWKTLVQNSSSVYCRPHQNMFVQIWIFCLLVYILEFELNFAIRIYLQLIFCSRCISVYYRLLNAPRKESRYNNCRRYHISFRKWFYRKFSTLSVIMNFYFLTFIFFFFRTQKQKNHFLHSLGWPRG